VKTGKGIGGSGGHDEAAVPTSLHSLAAYCY